METPQLADGIDVLFIAGFGPIVSDEAASRALYVDALRLPLEALENNLSYLHTQRLPGAKYFGLWPLSQASRSCFGTDRWPADRPAPQFWLEFDVADIDRATEALEKAGYELLLKSKREPWGQTVTRFLGPEGGLLAVTHTPWFRED